MRKLPRELENPVDDILITIADNTDGIYRKLNMTANHLTTISLILGILAAYYLYIGKNAVACLMFVLAYYYDCMDGNYARKYNQTSQFGDYYDHISDAVKALLTLFVMYKVNSEKFVYCFVILVLLQVFMLIHFGCQERISKTEHNYVLSELKGMCPDEGWIRYTKWFGSGTIMLIWAIIIYTY